MCKVSGWLAHQKKHSIKNTVSSHVQKNLDFAAPSLEFSGNGLNRARIKLREKENQLSA
jgi:hypothetical protein